jgi:hypothetical protein
VRATHFPITVFLKHVVDARLKRVWAEEESIAGYGICVGLSESVLVFANDFDIGAHQHLEARTEAVSRLVL